MVMRPIGNSKIVKKEKQMEVDEDSAEDDGVVIVAFPSSTWRLVLKKSEEMGVSAGEVVALAVQGYCEGVE